MSIFSCFPIQWLASFFFAVWRMVMGMRSPVAAALLFPPHSPAGATELWDGPPAPCLGAEAMLRAGEEGQGGLNSFLSSCPWGCRSEKGNPTLLGHWREGTDHILTFNMGHAILSPSQCWLEGDALATGRGKVFVASECPVGTRKAVACLKACGIVCHSSERRYLNACSWMTCFPLPAPPSLPCYNFAEFLGAVYFEVWGKSETLKGNSST